MFHFEFIFNQSENYKQSYYCRKFGCEASDYEGVTQIKRSYIAGIIWNYYYYYRYCASWNSVLPVLLRPPISDLYNFSTLDFRRPQAVPAVRAAAGGAAALLGPRLALLLLGP